MATHAELFGLRNNTDLRNKIAAAIAIKADDVRLEAGATPNHANRLIWAKSAFADPTAMADRMMWAILAANRAATVAAINGAIDADITTAVANAIDIFATP